jgi:hypothetical protein
MFSENHARIAAGRVLNHRATCTYEIHPSHIDIKWLESFMSEYKIARNIPVKDRDEVVSLLNRTRPAIEAIDEAAATQVLWSIFSEIEEAIPDNKNFSNFPSLTSKVIWAIRPEVGIVYDKFASIGLNKLGRAGLTQTVNPKVVCAENYLSYISAWIEVYRSKPFTALCSETGQWLEDSFANFRRTRAFDRHLLDQCLVLHGMKIMNADTWRYTR